MELIDKSAVVAEIERIKANIKEYCVREGHDRRFDVVPEQLAQILSFIDTLEVKEMDITKMADEYYDALMKESDWMDVDTMGHCRLAYYNGCKDVLNKIQKGE